LSDLKNDREKILEMFYSGWSKIWGFIS